MTSATNIIDPIAAKQELKYHARIIDVVRDFGNFASLYVVDTKLFGFSNVSCLLLLILAEHQYCKGENGMITGASGINEKLRLQQHSNVNNNGKEFMLRFKQYHIYASGLLFTRFYSSVHCIVF